MSKKKNKTKSLLLFTDGSSMRIEGINYIASAYVIVDASRDDAMVYEGSSYESNSKSLNDQSEMEAVLLGLRRIDLLRSLKKIKLQKNRVNITVVTDAEYVRKTFMEFIPGWIRKYGHQNCWYNSKKQPIAHQGLIKNIFYNFVGNKKYYNIRFFHINSHIKKDGLQKCYQKFKKKNKVDITMEQFMYLVKYNERCDKLASDTLHAGLKNVISDLAFDNLVGTPKKVSKKKNKGFNNHKSHK